MRQAPRRFQARAVEQLVAQQVFEKAYIAQINHIYNAKGKRETIDSVCKGPQMATWLQSLSNEWGRLAQGNKKGLILMMQLILFHNQKSQKR